MDQQSRITLNPDILSGKPIIRGTRLSVEFIIDLLAQGWSTDEVLRNYPGISSEDIQACLGYASAALRAEKVKDIRMDAEKMKNNIDFLNDVSGEVIDSLPEQLARPIKQVTEFRKTLSSETDRGCALMAAAYMDEKLGELLKVYLIEDGKVIKHMFEFNGPFGTFSSRIDAAYALGLLPKNVRKDMHLLRKIRNDFGHNSSPVTFEDESISSKCGALYLDGKNNTSRPRGKFTRAMMAALGVIELSTQQTERCSVMEDHDIALNQKGIDSFREFLKDTDMDELLELVR